MKFQLLTGYINLAGNRDSVTFRGPDDPMTYPEMLVLQVIHGGEEHVTDLVEVGEIEREPADELSRLAARYPAGVIRALFPSPGGRPALPARDDNLPTSEEVAAAREAAEDAKAKTRAKRKAPKKGAAVQPERAVPDLEQLPED